MAILANRVKTANIFSDFLETLKGYFAKSISVMLIAASCLLIYSSENNKAKEFIFDTASNIVNPISLAYDSLSQNILYTRQYIENIFTSHSQNIALKLENAKLQGLIEEAARLKAENITLKKQLNFKEASGAKIHLSTRLISNFSGMYSKGGIIAAGIKDGIENNQIITSEGKIIGKISFRAENYSRIMFLNDSKSRIPVITTISKEKAILTGDGHKGGKLLYVADGHKIKVGEHIMSSGDGKYYPFGIPIAKVVKVDNINIYVEPLVDLTSLQFVNVLRAVK